MKIARTEMPKKETLDCDECGKSRKVLYELTPDKAEGAGNKDIATWMICYGCLLGLPNKIKYTKVDKQ